jgi:hypothetical protein
MAEGKRSGRPEEAHLDKSDVAPDLQEQADEATEKGFVGESVDPTPNENYSLQTPPDAPTPETHPDAAEEANKRTSAVASRFPNRDRKES